MTIPDPAGKPRRAAALAPVEGFRLYPGALSAEAQARLAAQVLASAEKAPFVRPVTPGGKPMSVRMTNLGPLGWVTDAHGYRYEDTHPHTGGRWPSIPPLLLELWTKYAGAEAPPDACLVNLYEGGASMGLHRDADEADFRHPVMSISLGDTAVFRLGGLKRSDPTRTIRLASGDICVLSGPARLAYHGVDRVVAGSSRLLPAGGRLNLTLRRAR
jgi:DNA oxidative demethylase